MAKFDDILEEIRNLKKVEVPIPKKVEIPISKKVEEKIEVPTAIRNERNINPNEINFGDYLIMSFGVLFALCWITAFCDMIGLK